MYIGTKNTILVVGFSIGGAIMLFGWVGRRIIGLSNDAELFTAITGIVLWILVMAVISLAPTKFPKS